MEKQKVLVIEEFLRCTNESRELNEKYTVVDTLNDNYYQLLGKLFGGIDKPLALVQTNASYGSCINVLLGICQLCGFDYKTVDVKTALEYADSDYFEDFKPFKLEANFGPTKKEQDIDTARLSKGLSFIRE